MIAQINQVNQLDILQLIPIQAGAKTQKHPAFRGMASFSTALSCKAAEFHPSGEGSRKVDTYWHIFGIDVSIMFPKQTHVLMFAALHLSDREIMIIHDWIFHIPCSEDLDIR